MNAFCAGVVLLHWNIKGGIMSHACACSPLLVTGTVVQLTTGSTGGVLQYKYCSPRLGPKCLLYWCFGTLVLPDGTVEGRQVYLYYVHVHASLQYDTPKADIRDRKQFGTCMK